MPIYALALSSFGLFLAVVLSYILPKNVYEYITSATGFIQFFNWIIILYTFIKYKPIMGYTSSSKKEWFTIILLVIVLFSSLLIPKQSIGFFGGTIILLSLFFLYYISKKLNLFDVW
ncbi:hypothetical protein [Thermoanaerobacter thermocopriae]|uniref:hypothetical protein n=1 Tax=Thermoanaerobacter thermocopriae TaxID=29350 RepID=UPI00210E508E|nr:hypothetical protein [Thermoanaerobacter thermocopriae]